VFCHFFVLLPIGWGFLGTEGFDEWGCLAERDFVVVVELLSEEGVGVNFFKWINKLSIVILYLVDVHFFVILSFCVIFLFLFGCNSCPHFSNFF
jgi:hypothetical protein